MSKFTRPEADILKEFFAPVIEAGIRINEEKGCENDNTPDKPYLIFTVANGLHFSGVIHQLVVKAWNQAVFRVHRPNWVDRCPLGLAFEDDLALDSDVVFHSTARAALLPARDALIQAHRTLRSYKFPDLCSTIAEKTGLIINKKDGAIPNKDGTASFVVAKNLLWHPSTVATNRINKIFKDAGLELSIMQQLDNAKDCEYRLLLTFDPFKGADILAKLRSMPAAIDCNQHLYTAYCKTFYRRLGVAGGQARYNLTPHEHLADHSSVLAGRALASIIAFYNQG